jgi:epoxyqueuosine reductase QueG
MRVEDLRRIVEAYVSSYPGKAKVRNWWRKPLLATAEVDDRFKILSKIASDKHLLPRDLLTSAKTLIVFFIPFVKDLIDENSPGKFPCRNWGVAYEATNVLIGLAAEEIREQLAAQGYSSALTPATHNFDEVKLVSRWSHKHLAYLSGLGRFGVNAQLITSSGCAGRLGSLVTAAELGNNPLVQSHELCLHKDNKECLKCLKRCPVGALREEGIDRQRCWTRLKLNLNHTEALAGLKETTHVCGKCVVDLPCSHFN